MNKITSAFKGILSAIGSLLFILFIIVMWSAQLKSCFNFEGSDVKSSNVKIIKASLANPIHKKLMERLSQLYASFEITDQDKLDTYFIKAPESLNAASFGNGRYILWESLADLPDWAIDSILAHEVAHDLLLHSRKMQGVDDVRNFFTEVLSLLGGADHRTEKTLHDWSTKLTLPRYSQKQEYEADEYAVQILYAFGYDEPNSVFANTLKYIKNAYGDSGGGFFDYHPSTDDRIQKIIALKK